MDYPRDENDTRSNPAVSKLTDIPPAVIELLSDDPKAFKKWVKTRAILAIDDFDSLIARDPTRVTPTQMIEYLNFLAKLSGAMSESTAPQQQNSGPAFSISINFPGAAPQKPLVLDNNQQEAIDV